MSSANAAALRSVTVGAWPVAMAVDARTARVFVVSNTPEGLVSILDAAGGMVRRTRPVGAHPMAVAVDAWHGRVFVANGSDSSVSVLDAGSGQVVRTIRVVQNPTVVSIDEQTGHIFVASNDVSNGASSSLQSTFDTPLLDRIAASLHNSIRTLLKGRTGSVSILNVNTGH
jgi:YVTN family beta-propeller protein